MMAERCIQRYEHHYFRGWVVAITRGGRRWVKHFSDKPGGRAAARRQARKYRDELERRLPRPNKIKQKYVLNRTGVVGVARVKERTRSGKVMIRYVASWPMPDGKRGKASFSVGFYGEEKAERLAIRARR
jgi:hypothetical protein